jgi:hypothetical protein
MNQARSLAPGRVPYARVVLIWALLAVLLLVRTLPQIAAQVFPDPDDMLRLVQVRDLIAGQGWFDVTQHRIAGPGGTPMHWSRLVDLPIVAIILLLAPLMGTGMAEQVAVVAVPLLTLGVIVLLTAHIAARWLDRDGVTLACLCLGLAPVMMAQVQPLRIDHHGWQIVCAMVALAGLATASQVRGAVLAGMALAVGLSISLELLPIAAAFGAVFALRWLANGRASGSLIAFLISLVAGLTIVFLATRGPGALAQHCDQISRAHLGFFAVVAAGAACLTRFHPHSRVALAAALALPVVAGVAYYLWAAPHCTAGPFAQLDPLVRSYWYEKVSEGRPAWRLDAEQWIPVVAQAVVALLALIHLWRSEKGRVGQFWGEYLLVFAVALATGLLVWRSLAFVGAFSAIPLGWLAARLLRLFGQARRAPRKVALAGVLIFALVPGFPITVAGAVAPPDEPEHGESDQARSAPARVARDAPGLKDLAPAKFFAPLDIGPELLMRTHHSVVATGHHRAPGAMHDVIATFIGSEENARTTIMRHGATYVVISTDLNELKLYRSQAPKGFAAQLLQGRAPDWLEPVEFALPDDVKVWRVVARPRGNPAPHR